jgi:hypothetical protein
MNVLWLALAVAQGDVESGPKVGEAIPALDAFAVVGEFEDKKVDYANLRKSKPTVFVFVNAEKWDRPIARYLRKLDEELLSAKDRSAVVAVWVSNDVEKSKEYLPFAQQSLKFESTALGVFVEPNVSPPKWEINANAALTTVVAKDGKAVAVFGYDSANDKDVAKVVAAWKKLDAKPKKKDGPADKKSADPVTGG